MLSTKKIAMSDATGAVNRPYWSSRLVVCTAAFVILPSTTSQSANAVERSPVIPDAQRLICDPIDRELARTGQRFRSAYQKGSLNFFKTHRGNWLKRSPASGRQVLLDMLRADPNPTGRVRTQQQQVAFANAKIRDHNFSYSQMIVKLPGMSGKYNVSRLGLSVVLSNGVLTEYRYIVSTGAPKVELMGPNILQNDYKSVMAGGYLYLLNEDGNVVSHYLDLYNDGDVAKPSRWHVLPGCQIKRL